MRCVNIIWELSVKNFETRLPQQPGSGCKSDLGMPHSARYYTRDLKKWFLLHERDNPDSPILPRKITLKFIGRPLNTRYGNRRYHMTGMCKYLVDLRYPTLGIFIVSILDVLKPHHSISLFFNEHPFEP